MTTKTAICKDSNGAFIPVHCKVWSNGQTTCLKRTKDNIRKDHPDLIFEAWVVDLSDPNALSLYFLSPSVEFKVIWVDTGEGFKQVRLNRDLTISEI